MCSIYGTIGIVDQKFYDEQHEIAISRGKEPTFIDLNKGRMFHYRTPTNNSTDKYPVVLDTHSIAMNGIVSQAKYKELVHEYGDIGYTVDTAYLLRELKRVDFDDFSIIDTLDYVFACWIITPTSVILANKDYPLHTKVDNGNVYFSSFRFDGSEPLNNKVLEIRKDMKINELYKFKNLIYGE
jgi:hypothetical protein